VVCIIMLAFMVLSRCCNNALKITEGQTVRHMLTAAGAIVVIR